MFVAWQCREIFVCIDLESHSRIDERCESHFG